MTESETLALARSLGVTLDLSEDSEHILAGPKENLTDELREAIRENRNGLIRTLLFWRAGEWITSLVSQGRPFEDPDEADEELNKAWLDEDLAGFRRALRAWAKAGLKNGRAA